jgi:hypothetical protein
MFSCEAFSCAVFRIMSPFILSSVDLKNDLVVRWLFFLFFANCGKFYFYFSCGSERTLLSVRDFLCRH